MSYLKINQCICLANRNIKFPIYLTNLWLKCQTDRSTVHCILWPIFMVVWEMRKSTDLIYVTVFCTLKKKAWTSIQSMITIRVLFSLNHFYWSFASKCTEAFSSNIDVFFSLRKLNRSMRIILIWVRSRMNNPLSTIMDFPNRVETFQISFLDERFLSVQLFSTRKIDVKLFQHQRKHSSFNSIYSCSETLSNVMHSESDGCF